MGNSQGGSASGGSGDINSPESSNKEIKPNMETKSSVILNESTGEATFQFTFENIKKTLKSDQTLYSQSYIIQNLPWRILLKPRVNQYDEKELCILLECNGESSHKSWSCKARGHVDLMNWNPGKEPWEHEFDRVFTGDEPSNFGGGGIYRGLKVDGYIKDDKLRVEVCVNADSPQGL